MEKKWELRKLTQASRGAGGQAGAPGGTEYKVGGNGQKVWVELSTCLSEVSCNSQREQLHGVAL